MVPSCYVGAIKVVSTIYFFYELCFTVNRYYFKDSTVTYKNGPYCYYEEGTNGSNIIISAPHGGDLIPTSIPDRDYGCWYTNEYGISECIWRHNCGVKSIKCKIKYIKDRHTKEIAIMLADNLEILTGKRPHLVVNQLHRSKLDANRFYAQATFYNPEAGHTYDEFNYFIQRAQKSIEGNGLYLDIHGQVHKEAWVELGYHLTKASLNLNTTFSEYSTIRALAKRSNSSFEELLRGSKSLGYCLQKYNIKTVPSPAIKSPGDGRYLMGHHNVVRYGSRFNGNIDAIQVEIPNQFRNSYKAPRFSRVLARAVVDFMKINNY